MKTSRTALTLLCSILLSSSLQAKRPNILFILADDQSPFDLKMYDPDSKLDTPALARLAAEGMVFDGAYHMGSYSERCAILPAT
jgi:choline-sulfatase